MSQALSNRICLVYALPVITTSWFGAPLGVVQGVYAKYYGLSLTTIASVLLLTRLFDAISDPLVGYYADRYYQRNGTYRPLIIAGGLLLIVSSCFLYVPLDILTLQPYVEVDALYFTSWLCLFYFSWTLFEMPHLAWSNVVAKKSKEKTKIYSFRNISIYIGLLFFYLIPLLPIFATNAITPETLEISVIVNSILMVIFLQIFYTKTSALSAFQAQKSIQEQNTFFLKSIGGRNRPDLVDLYRFFRSVIENKPLLIFITAFLAYSSGTGIWYSLIFLYVDTYLGLGDKFAEVFIFAFVVGILATPIWYKVAIRLGKKTTWLLATLLLVGSYIYTGFLEPGETDFMMLVVLKVFQTLGFTCIGVVAPAMFAEIIDYSNWKNHTHQNATYFSIYAFMQKTTIAVATALGLGIAGFYGFDATVKAHDTDSVFGITLAISWLPAVFGMLGGVFIMLCPINERRHQIIRRHMDTRSINRKKVHVIN